MEYHHQNRQTSRDVPRPISDCYTKKLRDVGHPDKFGLHHCFFLCKHGSNRIYSASCKKGCANTIPENFGRLVRLELAPLPANIPVSKKNREDNLKQKQIQHP